ncbi:MAG: hypothetical protein WD022_03660 [Balneolaceae bacterium]
MGNQPTKKIYLPILLILLVFSGGCGLFNNDSPAFFTVTPISAVEAALEINALPGAEVTIARNGQEMYSFRMTRSDTVVYDGGLSPATSYIWKASRSSGRIRTVERQATTLDTTSHAFTWQKFEFGEYSYSSIKDVAIIDEDNIWAVGEIYMNDSTGQEDVTPYNAVHWDGEEWQTIRLKYNCRLYFPNCGPVTDLYADATSIIAFGANDIWITAGTVHHFDGDKWEQFAGVQGIGSSNAVWGNSSNNLWFVGNSGFLTHYNGSEWKKLESGTAEHQ